MEFWSVDALINGALLFFGARILLVVVIHRRMFVPKYGRGHRFLGLLMIVHMAVGLADACVGDMVPPPLVWVYDATLSVIGFSVSYSAACEFGPAHKHVRNEASGVLDQTATVTVAEMLEHCFYQLLNLVQALYLHAPPHLPNPLPSLSITHAHAGAHTYACELSSWRAVLAHDFLPIPLAPRRGLCEPLYL